MRFLLFDRVTALESGRSIQGVKTVTLTEAYLDGHFPKQPLVPGSLLIEAMIQLLGWVPMEKHGFSISVVLTALQDVSLPSDLRPGQRLDLHGELMGTNKRGSVGRAWAEIDGTRIAEVGRVLYGHFPQGEPEVLRQRFRYYGGPV
jgi:3-hydroxyacyl-[acyl-carrier-protein] dehydratase